MSTTVENTVEGVIFTIDQAAAYLSIPKANLYTWRTRRVGFGPRAVKLGGCLRYRRSDLDAWVAEHVENFDDFPAAPEQRAAGLDRGHPAYVPQDGRDPDLGKGQHRDRLPTARPLLLRHHPRVLHLQAGHRG